MRKNKLLLLLALLMTAATGAWGQNSTTYNVTFGGFGNSYMNITVETTLPITFEEIDDYLICPWQVWDGFAGCNDYEFTGASVTSGGNGKVSVNFVDWSKITITVTGTFEGTATIHVTGIDDNEVPISCDITVACTLPPQLYTVSMKSGTQDADKWTVKVGEGQAQALPIGGLKGDGSETVTLQYNGRLKVKGVKATSDAAPAAVPVTAITLNKTETSIKVGATETLSVTSVLPEEATDKTYTWKTSDETKATVDQNGKVTAVAAGTVTIYAEANDGSGVKGNCAVTVTPAIITVTWNNDDITGTGMGTSFSKDGVTITAEEIDFRDKNLMGGGTFTTTLGNFTKIEVTCEGCEATGTGWSGNFSKKTWAGTPASTVNFSGNFMGMGMGITIVCTIEPKN